MVPGYFQVSRDPSVPGSTSACPPGLSQKTAVRMLVLRGVERRVFTAYPRWIAATKAEVLYVALKLRVRIVAIVRPGLGIGSTNISSMMNPDMAGN